MKITLPKIEKIIIEPTSRCNLQCTTCMRNTWDEPQGDMSMDTFNLLMRGITYARPKKISFWGIGEPLMNPRIVEMVRKASALGASTELITNGALLGSETAGGLIDAGLETLIVSLDGVSAETHESVRPGINARKVYDNIAGLRELRHKKGGSNPVIGVEFVAMRSNLSHLPELPDLAMEVGAEFIIVTNVLPYSAEMKDEILCWITSSYIHYPIKKKSLSGIYLPPIDNNPENIEHLAVRNARPWGEMELNVPRTGLAGYCPFVNSGTLAVTWDGKMSPCVPLMHTHSCFILGREKQVRRHIIGDVKRDKIKSVWEGREHRSFQRRVLDFMFPPCLDCGGCEMVESNDTDCFANPRPTCGDCLWSRGIIICP